jgi:hypothetical protein
MARHDDSVWGLSLRLARAYGLRARHGAWALAGFVLLGAALSARRPAAPAPRARGRAGDTAPRGVDGLGGRMGRAQARGDGGRVAAGLHALRARDAAGGGGGPAPRRQPRGSADGGVDGLARGASRAGGGGRLFRARVGGHRRSRGERCRAVLRGDRRGGPGACAGPAPRRDGHARVRGARGVQRSALRVCGAHLRRRTARGLRGAGARRLGGGRSRASGPTPPRSRCRRWARRGS